MVYICMYGPSRYPPLHYFNEIRGMRDELILLKGNTRGILWFYSTLKKSESTMDPSMKLMLSKTGNIRMTNIKSIICIITKSSKEEDFSIMDLGSFKNDIVTVVRDNVTVPIILKETKQIDEDGNDEKWILDVMDVIHRQMSMVYTLRLINKSVLGIQRNRRRATRNDIDDYKLIVLMGNTKEVRCFYSDLSKSEKTIDSYMNLMPLVELQKPAIKGIICVVAKFSKEEDFLLFPKVQSQFDVDTVTVVRDKMTVPNLLKETKQVSDNGTDDKWLLDVMDIINRKMSMVYILRYSEDRSGNESYDMYHPMYDEHYRLIWLMGNTNEIRWFYSALSQSKKISRKELLHVPSKQLHTVTVQNIIYIIGKTTTEDSLQLPNFKPANVITVVLENIQVPNFLKETKQINVTGNDDKWLLDVLDEIKITGKFLKVFLI
ncbi:unnamed protein product [Mytilus coruscus]|uniref:Uncharacterized protein n=1 Tax=Mytilus coruscus TaxID=42192 RepID=A0A6J8AEE8_MYTCO|nr:unnamed protein product [Mytilus coruscus]